MTPNVQVNLAHVNEMLAVSLMDSVANPDAEVLVKEDDSWDNDED